MRTSAISLAHQLRSLPRRDARTRVFHLAVNDLHSDGPAQTGRGEDKSSQERLLRAVESVSHLLPAQGPITVFIHHNTLHAFEDLTFEDAVVRGGKIFGCRPFLPESRFRAELAKGRIRFADLRAVLAEDLGGRAVDLIAPHCTRLELRLAMLQHALQSGTSAELRWHMAESDSLRAIRPETSTATRDRLIAETRRWVMRDLRGHAIRPPWLTGVLERFDEPNIERWKPPTWEAFTLEALWHVCIEKLSPIEPAIPMPPALVRHRDWLLAATGTDTDRWVHETLIRFCAAFVDQGISHWPLPNRESGFLQSFCSLYRDSSASPEHWRRDLAAELARIQDAHLTPLEVVHQSLDALGIQEPEWNEFLSATLLALRGWGGIIQHIEERPDRVAHPLPSESLLGFLAVRLVLDRVALGYAAKRLLGLNCPLSELRDILRRQVPSFERAGLEERAFPIFLLAQILGWTPDELHQLSPAGWNTLVREVEAFPELERRRLFHLAYERRFRAQTLDSIALHLPCKVERPRFQVMTCLDEREESFRRHIEEVAPDCETYGVAGFYGVAMYYRGAAEAHFVPLCPVVIRPQHWVEEAVDETVVETHERARKVRRALGHVSHTFHVGTRTFAFGALLSAGLGALASIPLVARVLFPGLTARLRRQAGQFVQPPKKTRLRLERTDSKPSPNNGGFGFSVEEMAGIGERVLCDVGLIREFSRLVILLGHGSHSMNNPHESAHDCGACGGSVGGPNGRAIAQILNDPRVRDILAGRGIAIPKDTVFVGGLHNTCNEYVKYADTDRVPETHLKLFSEARDVIEQALNRNAHERCRRFESAPLTITEAGARQHLDNRAEDLAQVRPEWGHATNAICIVGRRERTRGLFFDRRAFLTSYDPTQDDAEATILTRTLSAVFPVCGGINLEYYFSHVDPTGYGCGTKLPHNITSLVGVMDGSASDLRTGLPWQMVEIHEPVRLMIVCEVKADVMMRVLGRNPMMMQMTANRWVQLAVLDPDSQAIKVFRNGAFYDYTPEAEYLPQAPSSVDWYRGWRDFLEFAEIGER
jgi:uncharacterized protein YbcC (UPF0753/DUF2309 family)